MVIQSLSTDQAVEMTVATVRIWDVQNAQTQAGYFRFTPQQFCAWKVTNGLYDIIGEDILQTPEGLILNSQYLFCFVYGLSKLGKDTWQINRISVGEPL